MSDFILCNGCSINLNFLIYIHNLYLNYFGDCNSCQTPKFPWIPIDKNSLLNTNELEVKIKNLWTVIISNNNLYYTDADLWINNEFSFNSLFDLSNNGEDTYIKTKKSFEAWYWNEGRNQVDRFGDKLVDEYYQKLIELANLKSSKLRDVRFCIEVVYDTPSNGWEIKGEDMIIISPNSLLPESEELFEVCS